MFKARHHPSGQDIIILDPRWRDQVEYLRAFDRRDALVCPGCGQPVRVRAGQTRRWHFAHKHLQNCPFERESQILLETRAVLYERLVEQFDAEAVTLEKILAGSDLPRHVDCWVEKDSQIFAYWIFDQRVPPDERKKLDAGFDELKIHVHWIFVADLLRVEQDFMQDRLHLTTTERAFIRSSAFDEAWRTHFEHLGGSLHYLNVEQRTWVTFRNLLVIHKPQLYTGTRLESPLNGVLVSPKTGEIFHPGETERLQIQHQKIRREQEKAKLRLQKAQEFFGHSPAEKRTAQKDEPSVSHPQPFERVGRCRICGIETSDWISYFGQTQECICRNCQDRV